MEKDPADTPERQEFYGRIEKHNLAPLWTVFRNLITPEPHSECVAHLWRYAEIKPYLLESGGLITAQEAERRVLILENPGLQGKSQITTSLYAGLQLVLPGEVAPAHRHSQSALRFVIDGQGAHTSVDGERTIMNVGDFVITPSKAWHDHGNESDSPMIWLDGLDIPIVSLFDSSFVEGHPQEAQPLFRPDGDSSARYGANMLPVGYESTSKASPIFNYPYERTRDALESMRKFDEWDPCHGLKMQYVNPVDGGYAMPTMATFMQLLPKGFSSVSYRSTDATVFVAVEGQGRTRIDGQVFEWDPQDVFVAPSWKWIQHEADTDATLFSFSDRACQAKLGLWREERGNA